MFKLLYSNIIISEIQLYLYLDASITHRLYVVCAKSADDWRTDVEI